MFGWLVLALLGAETPDASMRVRYDDQSVVRVIIQDRADLELVTDIARDVWTERPRPGPVDLVVDGDGLAALGASGFPYEVVISDLQGVVDQEHMRLGDDTGGVAAPGPFFDDYRPYAQVLDHIESLALARPDLANTIDLGLSIEGREIRGIRIGTAPDAPGILLNGCQHAREWITVMVTTCIADTLVGDYDVDPEISSLVDQINFYVVPIVNPDGYIYTWNQERFWRKNRRGSYGIDLNRNWGVAWGGDGSSGELDSGNYRGEAPFSEPETAAVRDLVLATPNMMAHIDYHAYGQLILYPWGFDYVVAPADQILSDVAGNMSDMMGSIHGEFYNPIQAADFYPAAGNMPDWTYGAEGLYGYTIELRPAEAPDDFVSGFVLPPEEIVPTCEEAMAGVKLLAEFTASARPGTPGDDGSVTDTGTPIDDLGGPVTTDGSTDTGNTTDGPPSTTSSSTSSTGQPPSGTDDSGSAGADGLLLAERGCACDATGSTPRWLWAVFLFLGRRRRSRRVA